MTEAIATARMRTTVAESQPPRRRFRHADLRSAANVMSALYAELYCLGCVPPFAFVRFVASL